VRAHETSHEFKLIIRHRPTWRTPIFLFSGIALAFMFLGFFVIEKDEPSTEEDKRVDWIGAALVTAGLVLIVFVLSDTPTASRGWRNPREFFSSRPGLRSFQIHRRAPDMIGLFVLGVLLVIFFVTWQYYLERRLENPNLPRTRWTAPPLMKPSMWTRAHGRFAVMQAIACINWAAFTIWIVWVELYYQTYLNLSPIHTMLRLLPMFASGIVGNVLIALTIGRFDVMYIVATGALMTGCADLLFAVIDPSATYWAFGFPAACLIVLGADFTFASGTLFIAKVSLPHEQSVAGALFQAMTQIGSAIGVSVSTIVFNGVLRTQSRRFGVVPDAQADNVPLPAQLKAYKAAMWTGFAFGVLCACCCSPTNFYSSSSQARCCVCFCAGRALLGRGLRRTCQLIRIQRMVSQQLTRYTTEQIRNIMHLHGVSNPRYKHVIWTTVQYMSSLFTQLTYSFHYN
jgi:predicted MFS family arabinose efflux permease